MRAPLALLPAALAAAPALAQPVLWDELTQGDLSNDRFHPTPLILPVGVSQLVGAMDGSTAGGIDRDYFSLTVPAGYTLSAIILEQYLSSDPVAFLGIQPGPTFPNDPETTAPGDLLGWLHFGADQVGLDLLPLMGANGQGFTPPLPAGTYSFWAQQTGEPTIDILDFVVTVPSPGTALPLAVSAIGLARGRVRRRALNSA